MLDEGCLLVDWSSDDDAFRRLVQAETSRNAILRDEESEGSWKVRTAFT